MRKAGRRGCPHRESTGDLQQSARVSDLDPGMGEGNQVSLGQRQPAKGPRWAGCRKNPRKYGPQISPRAYTVTFPPTWVGQRVSSQGCHLPWGALHSKLKAAQASDKVKKQARRVKRPRHAARRHRAYRCLKEDSESGARRVKLLCLASKPKDVGRQPVACSKVQMQK